MSKDITAMQEMIDRIQYLNKTYDDAGLRTCLQIATELLEMEKQNITDAWINAKESKVFGYDVFSDAEIYYNQTFKKDTNG